jgi:hypothetical protein
VPGRYQFSLPERRSRDGWFRIGSLDVTTTAFMVLAGVVSMFWYAVHVDSLAQLVFSGDRVRGGELWRLVTWPLVNPPDNIWVVLTFAFFWFVGHAVEDRIGRQRFTVMIFATTVIPAALVTIISFGGGGGAFGLGVLGIGLLVVYALDNPGAMFFFGIPAWVIAAVYVGIDVLRLVGNRQWEQLVLELAVVAVALFSARQYGMVESLAFVPRVGNGGRTRGKPTKQRPRGKQRGESVVQGPWAQPAPSHSPADEAELNDLLDKISAHGIDALSRAEKARLNELSKKLRGR